MFRPLVERIIAVVFVLVFFICYGVAGRIEYEDQMFADSSVVAEAIPLIRYENINVVGEFDILCMAEDGSEIKGYVDDEVVLRLKYEDDQYTDENGTTYELRPVDECLYKSDCTEFSVGGYANPNLRMLYSVYEKAPSDTNFVLLRLSNTCVTDEIVAYGRR